MPVRHTLASGGCTANLPYFPRPPVRVWCQVSSLEEELQSQKTLAYSAVKSLEEQVGELRSAETSSAEAHDNERQRADGVVLCGGGEMVGEV